MVSVDQQQDIGAKPLGGFIGDIGGDMSGEGGRTQTSSQCLGFRKPSNKGGGGCPETSRDAPLGSPT